MTPPGTPRNTTANGAPKQRRKHDETHAAPTKPKAKRQADEGKRTRPPTEIDERLAKAITSARKVNGLTQQEMADGMHMSLYAYGRLERVQVSWLVQQLVAAADCLNVASTDLLISAGLSSNPGISPEAAISRDPRLTPAQRGFYLDQYRDTVRRNHPADGS